MKPRAWRVAISGYGHLGVHLGRLLAVQPWCRIVAVADTSETALARAHSDLGLTTGSLFRGLDWALAATDADVAVINTPSEFHYAHAKLALERGLHVLVAKPMTHEFEHGVHLVELARKTGRTLAVGLQIRYNRHYRAVKTFLDSGALGEVGVVNFLNSKHRPQPGNFIEMAQPALLEMSCHHFDLLTALLPQAAPEYIVCEAFRPSWSTYHGACMVNALIRLERGIHVLYHAGFSAQADCYELRLEGARGVLRCRGMHMSVDEMHYEFAHRGGRFAPLPIDRNVPPENPWERFLAIWRTYLEGGSEPPFSGKNNLRVLALLCAGIDSLRSRRVVRVADSKRFRAVFADRRHKLPSG